MYLYLFKSKYTVSKKVSCFLFEFLYQSTAELPHSQTFLYFRHLHGLGGSGSGCWPSGGVLADTRSRPSFQLLTAQTHHEHQEDPASHFSPFPFLFRPLKVVRFASVRGPSNLPGGPEQGVGPEVAWRGSDLLLQPCDLQGLQTAGGVVHQLQNDRTWLKRLP